MSAFSRLAVDGGTPTLAEGHVACWPQFTSDDDLTVLRAAHRASLVAPARGAMSIAPPPGRGEVAKLERAWAATTGRAEVVACASAADAVGLLIAGLELEGDDEIIVPTGARLAPALAAAGIVPVPVDIDPGTLHIDPEQVVLAITARTRAVMVVDRFGTTADYGKLDAVAEANGIPIIEDGSASIGATFERRPVGSLGSTSICVLPQGGASLAIGSGALYSTDDPAQAANVRRVLLVDDPLELALSVAELPTAPREPAPTFSPPLFDDGAGHSGGRRMSEVDAAIAAERIDAIERDVEVRSANGNHLRRALDGLPGIRIPSPVRGATHTYSTFPMVVAPDELGLPETAASAMRDTLVDCMTAEGLWIDSARLSSDPPPGDRFPVAEAAVAGGLLLGRRLSPLTSPNAATEMDRVADCFTKILIDHGDRVRQLTTERADHTP